MGWTRTIGRAGRDRRRPGIECLEDRQMLSVATAPIPEPAGVALNPNGSTDYDAIIQASNARTKYGVDGTGNTVAVIDTGVNYNNPAFIEGSGNAAKNKVVARVDFTGSANGVLPTSQHGTGVAGVIAGSTDSGHPGVAPGADIVALRVFGDDGKGDFSKIADAMQWVVDNHSAYNITVVNLSLSDGNNYTTDYFSQDGSIGQRISGLVDKLEALNIPVVTATGNSFNGKQGEGFISILPDTISVTGTDASDRLAGNAQRLGKNLGGKSATDLAAPGIGITAPAAGSGFISEDGTSFAAPQVAGGVVLLQQIYQKAYNRLPTVAQLDDWLERGASTISDSVTGISIGRLNILNAAQVVEDQIKKDFPVVVTPTPTPSPTPTPTPVPTPTPTPVPTPTPTPTPVPTPTPTPSTNPTPTPTNPPAQSPTPTPTPSPTPTPTPSPTPTPTATQVLVAETQVFINGVSSGKVRTDQLAAAYPTLVTSIKGGVGSFRVWADKGTTVNLGKGLTPKPSGVSHKHEAKFLSKLPNGPRARSFLGAKVKLEATPKD